MTPQKKTVSDVLWSAYGDATDAYNAIQDLHNGQRFSGLKVGQLLVLEDAQGHLEMAMNEIFSFLRAIGAEEDKQP